MLTETVLGLALLGVRPQAPIKESLGTSYVSNLNRTATSRIMPDGSDDILSSRVDATGIAVVGAGLESVVEDAALVLQELAILPGDSRADDAIDRLIAEVLPVERTSQLPLVD